MSEHTGTHIDAPLHFIAECPAHYGVDEISLDRLVGRAATIEATGLEPGGLLDADHIIGWEREHGPLKTGDKVLFDYGWDERWGTGTAGRTCLEVNYDSGPLPESRCWVVAELRAQYWGTPSKNPRPISWTQAYIACFFSYVNLSG